VRTIGEIEVVSESAARFADTRLAGPEGKLDGKNGVGAATSIVV
jgi:hypothetical protein